MGTTEFKKAAHFGQEVGKVHSFRRWTPLKREVCSLFSPPRHLMPFPQRSSYILHCKHHTPFLSSLEKWLSRAFSVFLSRAATDVIGGRNGLSNAPQTPPSSIINFSAVGSSRSWHSLWFLVAKRSPRLRPQQKHGNVHIYTGILKQNRLAFKGYKREDSVLSVGLIQSLATTASAAETFEWLERLPEPSFSCRMFSMKAKRL